MRLNANLTTAKRRGWIRLLIGTAFLSGFGMLLLHWGWQGWTTGEIMVHPKGQPAYLAAAKGPFASTFLFAVWTRLILGAALVLVGPVMALYLFLAPRERLARGLVSLGLQSPTSGSPAVPVGLVVAVLVALFVVLAYLGLTGV